MSQVKAEVGKLTNIRVFFFKSECLVSVRKATSHEP